MIFAGQTAPRFGGQGGKGSSPSPFANDLFLSPTRWGEKKGVVSTLIVPTIRVAVNRPDHTRMHDSVVSCRRGGRRADWRVKQLAELLNFLFQITYIFRLIAIYLLQRQ